MARGDAAPCSWVAAPRVRQRGPRLVPRPDLDQIVHKKIQAICGQGRCFRSVRCGVEMSITSLEPSISPFGVLLPDLNIASKTAKAELFNADYRIDVTQAALLHPRKPSEQYGSFRSLLSLFCPGELTCHQGSGLAISRSVFG